MGATILPVYEEPVSLDLRARPMLVAHPCEACRELTTRAVLCVDCTDKAKPHRPGDPYDIIGGEAGTE